MYLASISTVLCCSVHVSGQTEGKSQVCIRFGVSGGEEGHRIWEGSVEVLEDGGRV